MQVVKRIIKFVIIAILLGFSSDMVAQFSNKQINKRIIPKVFINEILFKNDSTKMFHFKPIRKINTTSLPFFCRIEEKMSRNAKFPVRIRLGNVDYVNKLEGKGH